MEKVRHQQLKILLACIAVLVTVFSVAMTFMPATVNAAEVITDTSYQSDNFSLPICSLDYGKTELEINPWFINFSFSTQQYVTATTRAFQLYFWGVSVISLIPRAGIDVPSLINVQGLFNTNVYFWADDTYENKYFLYRLQFPKELNTVMKTAANVMPKRITAKLVEAPTVLTYDYVYNGETIIIPPDSIYSEIEIDIVLNDVDSTTIKVFFPQFYNYSDFVSFVKDGVFFDYFLAEGLDEDIAYNIGYKDGYKYANGTINTSSDSYIYGYETGQLKGYSDGYAQGTADSGQYTFFSLISSVIDVPIKAIKGLLDFNLFGVDMSSLYLSLFTLCIVIMVIKLLL